MEEAPRAPSTQGGYCPSLCVQLAPRVIIMFLTASLAAGLWIWLALLLGGDDNKPTAAPNIVIFQPDDLPFYCCLRVSAHGVGSLALSWSAVRSANGSVSAGGDGWNHSLHMMPDNPCTNGYKRVVALC